MASFCVLCGCPFTSCPRLGDPDVEEHKGEGGQTEFVKEVGGQAAFIGYYEEPVEGRDVEVGHRLMSPFYPR